MIYQNQSLTPCRTDVASREMNQPQKQFSLNGAASRSTLPSVSVSRRRFIAASGVAASAFAIVPRHVLGGAGFVAPSEKITLACIGFGTQAIREIGGVLPRPGGEGGAGRGVGKEGGPYPGWGKKQNRGTNPRPIRGPPRGGGAHPRARGPG